MMLKVLKWLVGVPVGIFALMVVWQLLFGKGTTIDPVAQSIANCYDDAKSYLSSDQARAAMIQAQCNNMQSDYNRMHANPTKIYGPETPAK